MNRNNYRYRSYNSAFTIVELLVVIVVIGILAAITIVAYSGISNRATISSMQSDLTNASTTLKLDQVTNSGFPASLALANGGKGITPSQSLDSIIYIPDNTSNPNNFCLMYRKGTNTYTVDNTSSVSSGVCLQNLVTNGDFSNGTSGWSSTYSSNSISNNTLSNLANGTNAGPILNATTGVFVVGHIYYFKAKLMITNSVCSYIRIYVGGATQNLITPIINTWYDYSFIKTAIGTSGISIIHTYADAATANGKVMQVQYVSVIDLTATFGAGNEPTQAQMDTIMSIYPNSWFNIVAKANL